MAPTSDPSALDARAILDGGLIAALLLCSAVLAAGWWVRDEQYVDAGFGLGYQLGVTGATMMLVLLLYSARKRWRAMAAWGPLSVWFRIHMWLGLAGPVAILLHSNFSLGSLNATIALVCMLLVSGSGIAGRVIYAKIHFGLYGRRILLREKYRSLTEADGILRPLLEPFPEVLEPLVEFEEKHTRSPTSALGALWRLCSIGAAAWRMRRKCDAMLDIVLAEEREAAGEIVRLSRNIAEFTAYERLFGLWHAIHLPLFFLMILTLAVHVVAVHMY